jgi:arylsulfatase A-like enzyme
VNGRRTRLESFYQEVVHVPLFLFLPEHLLTRHPEFGVHSDRLTQHADLLPTILQLAGFVRNAGNAEFLDALTGTSIFGAPVDRPVFFINVNALRDWPRRGFAILYENRFKYIVSQRSQELYDLEVDPGEQRNLIGRPDLKREATAISRLVQSNTLLRTVTLRQ